ncbi:hypothetical protein AMECASPLE_032878 [Ameca splendens]|uniref:Secreted protein n=1 Tax=Ameca splendens TaxID=208324 RepID=A0ABV0Y7C5_9TELE
MPFLRTLLSVSSTFFLSEYALCSFLKQLSFPISNVPFHFYVLFRLNAIFTVRKLFPHYAPGNGGIFHKTHRRLHRSSELSGTLTAFPPAKKSGEPYSIT